MTKSKRSETFPKRVEDIPDRIDRFLKGIQQVKPNKLSCDETDRICLALRAVLNLFCLRKSYDIIHSPPTSNPVANRDAVELEHIASEHVWLLCASLLNGLYEIQCAHWYTPKVCAKDDPGDPMGDAIYKARRTLVLLDALNEKLRTITFQRHNNAHAGAASE